MLTYADVGNSGSPVLNAEGEFVAINFDRQRQVICLRMLTYADVC